VSSRAPFRCVKRWVEGGGPGACQTKDMADATVVGSVLVAFVQQ